jgi:hypothetical protein
MAVRAARTGLGAGKRQTKNFDSAMSDLVDDLKKVSAGTVP